MRIFFKTPLDQSEDDFDIEVWFCEAENQDYRISRFLIAPRLSTCRFQHYWQNWWSLKAEFSRENVGKNDQERSNQNLDFYVKSIFGEFRTTGVKVDREVDHLVASTLNIWMCSWIYQRQLASNPKICEDPTFWRKDSWSLRDWSTYSLARLKATGPKIESLQASLHKSSGVTNSSQTGRLSKPNLAM